MKFSILIVSKNRKKDLEKTLYILQSNFDRKQQEIRVLLDGCSDNSSDLTNTFKDVKWTILEKSLGASMARSVLYKKAKGNIFIGLDDDAHPLQKDFLNRVNSIFNKRKNIGVIAFKEIRGVFDSDIEALKLVEEQKEYLCSEFIGCGFAIRKDVYEKTNGFPTWVDIYGEEACLSLEVINKGFDLLYTTDIAVNHRVDKLKRLQTRNNYFRFSRQLKNSGFYYLVYFKYPLKPIFKLFAHNFLKYGLKNLIFFYEFLLTSFLFVYKIPHVMKYRNTINKRSIAKIRSLPFPGKI